MNQVTKSLLSLVVMGAIAAGVGVFAWVRGQTQTDDAARHDDALIRLDTERISRFDIQEQGHLLRVERSEEGWFVMTPLRIAADPEAVEQVLSGLGRLRAKQRFSASDPPPSDGAMGLEEPAVVISAWTDEQPPRRVRVELGKISDFNRQEYARYTGPDVGEEPLVVMLASGSRRSVVRTAQQLYDKRVLGARVDEVVKVRVEPKVPDEERVAFTLERSPGATADAGFHCVEPFVGEVDMIVVRRVMEGLSAAPIAEFLTLDAGGELEPFGLKEPSFLVTVWVRSSEGEEPASLVERRILVSEPLPGSGEGSAGSVRVARSDQPWVGTANAILWHALPHSLDDLKTKRLTAVDRSLVQRIELELKSGEHVAMERTQGQQGGWQLLAPEPGKASPQAVNAFLLSFTSLTGVARELEGEAAKDAGRLKALGLDESAQKIRLLDADNKPLAVLRIGRVDGDEVLVLREGADFVARVSQKRLADLPANAAALMD